MTAGTGAVPRRTVVAFLLVRGFSSAAYFTLVPFLGLWLIRTRDMDGVEGGTVVAACLLFGKAGGLLVSRLITALGLRRSVLVSYVIATAALLLMVAYQGRALPVWVVLASLLGLSFSAATAALKALVAAAHSAEERLRGFSHLNLAVNAGAALGSAAGGVLLTHFPSTLPVLGVVLYLCATLAALRLPRPAAPGTEDAGAVEGAGGAGRTRRPFLVFLGVTMLTWVAYAQVFDVLPTYAADSPGPQQVSLLFVANALLIIVLQTPVTSFVQRLEARRPGAVELWVVPGAHLLMAVSVVVFALVVRSPVVVGYVAVLLFTLSELVWGPIYHTKVVEVKGRMTNVTAYSLAGLAWGVAESGGTWLGMALVTAAGLSWPMATGMYWISALAMVAAALYFAVHARAAGRPAASGKRATAPAHAPPASGGESSGTRAE
ncbi:MFS transporter [Streptomyces sp. NPDC001889]